MPFWQLLLMERWGSIADLAWWCQTPSLMLTHSIEGYHLRSIEFEALSDPEEVYNLAQERVGQLNGLGRLLLPGFQPIRLAPSVTRKNEDGTSKTWVFPRERQTQSEMRTKPSEAATAIPATQINEWLTAAASSAMLTKALRMFGVDQHDWVSLYKILEIVRAEVQPSIEKLGWATKAELRRFTQTANSAEAIGDGARHSPGKFEIPRQPMTLLEATELISRLLRFWVQSSSPVPMETDTKTV